MFVAQNHWLSLLFLVLLHQCGVGVMGAQIALIAALGSSVLLGLVSHLLHNAVWILCVVQVRQVCCPVDHSATVVFTADFGTFC